MALPKAAIAIDVRSPTLRIQNLRWVLVALWTSLFVIHSLIYLALIPPWQAPDEPTSIELLLTMEARGWLVSPADMDLGLQQAIIESMEREHYWELGAYGRRPSGQDRTLAGIYKGSTQLHRPPLYHAMFLPLARLVRAWPIEQQLLVFRAASIMFGVVTVAVAALIGYELVGVHPALPLVIPALAAFHPQLAYSSATFNSDNLVATLGALLFFVLLRMLQQGITVKRLLLLGLLVILGFFTKRTFLFVVPVLGLAIVWQVFQAWRSRGPALRKPLLYTGIGLLLTALALLAIPGLWHGLSSLVDRFVFNASRTNDRALMFYSLSAAPRLLKPWLTKSLPFLNRSFWGSFGWHQAAISTSVAYALLLLVGITWALTLVWLAVLRRRTVAWLRRYVWLCLWAIVISIVIMLLNAPPTLGMLPQGRYLFSVFMPVVLLMGIGLCWWWPRRWTTYGVNMVWLALIALDVYCIAGVVIPGFYR